jgi:hypothetical protein
MVLCIVIIFCSRFAVQGKRQQQSFTNLALKKFCNAAIYKSDGSLDFVTFDFVTFVCVKRNSCLLKKKQGNSKLGFLLS